jgi:hypothetical protein
MTSARPADSQPSTPSTAWQAGWAYGQSLPPLTGTAAADLARGLGPAAAQTARTALAGREAA